ncbi:thrombospondin type 3 repeat-containing protein [Sorangium sp. So ce590]|uniref:thrombospondin type 3 repeat-containing protein n=1 Tax=Sorangium sp. So ce590 TaxID=3133317 RepID=UPI003F63454A
MPGGDYLGDACDSDDDADGVPDASDNCIDIPNPGQENNPKSGPDDGLGDVCDADDDNDGADDEDDNCPFTANPPETPGGPQADNDHTGGGDACDPDDDNDGVPDDVDNSLASPGDSLIDTDGDGGGSACDPDDDGDGVFDVIDNCPLLSNPVQPGSFQQLDTDDDGEGDPCDADRDNDGVPNASDNCSLIPNLAQLDRDDDGIGDACECLDTAQLECDDGNPCTLNDTCQNRECTPGVAVVCPDPLAAVCKQGWCSDDDGACRLVPRQEGTPCSGGICIAGGCWMESLNEDEASGSGGGRRGRWGGCGWRRSGQRRERRCRRRDRSRRSRLRREFLGGGRHGRRRLDASLRRRRCRNGASPRKRLRVGRHAPRRRRRPGMVRACASGSCRNQRASRRRLSCSDTTPALTKAPPSSHPLAAGENRGVKRRSRPNRARVHATIGVSFIRRDGNLQPGRMRLRSDELRRGFAPLRDRHGGRIEHQHRDRERRR